MANILLRGLDESVVSRLKASAAAHGHSLQAEIRQSLTVSSLKTLAETRRLSVQWLDALANQQADAAPPPPQPDEPTP
jgi:plasmid stability protein